MKILHITPCYEPAFEMGGVVRSISQLCRGLAQMGQDVTVFTTNANPLGKKLLNVPLNKKINVGGVKVWYFPVKFFKNRFFYSPELNKACYSKMKEFDILHLTSFWCYPGIPGGRAARKYKIPYILSPSGTLDLYSLRQKKLKKRLYLWFSEKKNLKSATAIHYTTELEKERTHQLNRLKNPYFVVPNPVPVEEFKFCPNKHEAKDYLDLPYESYIISFIGRLHKCKALDILILAFNKITNNLNNCYLLLAGPDDGDGNRLQKLVKEKKLGNKVKFLGFVNSEEKKFILGASDLFWFASFGENFGCSAVEAMAAGVPVILSKDVDIWKEVIQDEAGIVVSHNPEEVAKDMLGLLVNKQRLKKMSGNALYLTKKRYSRGKVCQQMLSEYRKVVENFRKNNI